MGLAPHSSARHGAALQGVLLASLGPSRPLQSGHRPSAAWQRLNTSSSSSRMLAIRQQRQPCVAPPTALRRCWPRAPLFRCVRAAGVGRRCCETCHSRLCRRAEGCWTEPVTPGPAPCFFLSRGQAAAPPRRRGGMRVRAIRSWDRKGVVVQGKGVPYLEKKGAAARPAHGCVIIAMPLQTPEDRALVRAARQQGSGVLMCTVWP